jgi:hypothetical protein
MNFTKAIHILNEWHKNQPKDKSLFKNEYSLDIEQILTGSHKTFRYILITALIAKCVEPTIHMRSLQKGAKLRGAYDARSLCHKVWVKFEKIELNNKLGGSNEPYLNKPARFPSIELTNPVRAGNNRRTLRTLFFLLEKLNDEDPEVMLLSLHFALCIILERKGDEFVLLSSDFHQYDGVNLYPYLDKYLAYSSQGETLISLFGAIITVYYSHQESEVEVHKSNQAGSSSKEIGDIDVRKSGKLILSIEVKDKILSVSDIEHAVQKTLLAGCRDQLFVIGRSSTVEENIEKLGRDLREKYNMDVRFLHIDCLIDYFVSMFDNYQRYTVVQLVAEILKKMKSRDETQKHFEVVFGDFIE